MTISWPPWRATCIQRPRLLPCEAKPRVTSGGSLASASCVPVCETPSPPMTMATRAPRAPDQGLAYTSNGRLPSAARIGSGPVSDCSINSLSGRCATRRFWPIAEGSRMTMTFFEAAAASSSGLTLMIEGPVEAAASFSESSAGASSLLAWPAAGAAISGVVTTTSAGTRNGLSRSEIAPAVASRQSAARPVPSDLPSNRRRVCGRLVPFSFCPRGRSISLGRGNWFTL